MNAPAAIPQLYLIPPTYVAQVWGLAQPYLEKVVVRGQAMQSTQQWLGECLNARKQLWLLSGPQRCEGAAITSLADTPHGLCCIIDACGAAKGSNWQPSLATIEAWAKAQKCSFMRLYGRIGWTDRLKDYALSGVILDRKL